MMNENEKKHLASKIKLIKHLRKEVADLKKELSFYKKPITKKIGIGI